MNESKPVDLDAIRAKMPRQIELGIGADIDDARALCDEVESLRERLKELEGNGEAKVFRSMEEFAKEYFPNSRLEYRLVNKDEEPTKGDQP